MNTDPELRTTAARLLAGAGRGGAVDLTSLAGGKNNQVFRLDTADGPLVLKRYFSDPRDTRDRLGAEWSFLRYAWDRGVRDLPEPIAAEPETHTALLGFVTGRKLAPAEVDEGATTAAVAFVLALNAAPRDPARLAPGSEACFSLAQHLATIDRRVGRLGVLAPDTPLRAEAERIVADRLQPLWRRLMRSIEAEARANGIDPDAQLDTSACCISPSDFGFHNALLDGPSLDQGRLTFLDFEYAGRDDPAKLVCDFFCQPELPVPGHLFDGFVEAIAEGLALTPRDRVRCRILRDAYRIKWACIMLNDFLPVGAARRAFAAGDAWTARCAAQLQKVETALAAVGHP